MFQFTAYYIFGFPYRLPFPRFTRCRIPCGTRILHRPQLCPFPSPGGFRKRSLDVRQWIPHTRNSPQHLLAKLGHQDRLPELGLSSHDVERVPRTGFPVCPVWRLCLSTWT